MTPRARDRAGELESPSSISSEPFSPSSVYSQAAVTITRRTPQRRRQQLGQSRPEPPLNSGYILFTSSLPATPGYFSLFSCSPEANSPKTSLNKGAQHITRSRRWHLGGYEHFLKLEQVELPRNHLPSDLTAPEFFLLTHEKTRLRFELGSQRYNSGFGILAAPKLSVRRVRCERNPFRFVH